MNDNQLEDGRVSFENTGGPCGTRVHLMWHAGAACSLRVVTNGDKCGGQCMPTGISKAGRVGFFVFSYFILHARNKIHFCPS